MAAGTVLGLPLHLLVAVTGGGGWGCWGWLGLVKHGDFTRDHGERTGYTGYQGDLAMKHAG